MFFSLGNWGCGAFGGDARLKGTHLCLCTHDYYYVRMSEIRAIRRVNEKLEVIPPRAVMLAKNCLYNRNKIRYQNKTSVLNSAHQNIMVRKNSFGVSVLL